jgi:hypothetical protein
MQAFSSQICVSGIQEIHLADRRVAPGAGADELACAHALVAIQVLGGGAHTLAEIAPVRRHEAAIVLAVQTQQHILSLDRIRIIHGPGSKIERRDAAAAIRGVRRANIIQARRVAVIIVVDCRDAVIRAAVAVLLAGGIPIRKAHLCFPVAVHANLDLAIRISIKKRVVSIALAVIDAVSNRGAAGPVNGIAHIYHASNPCTVSTQGRRCRSTRAQAPGYPPSFLNLVTNVFR